MVKRAKRNNTDPKVASILLHFDTTYTADLGRLAVFQQLCKDLDVVVGRSLTQCKKVLEFSTPSPNLHTNQFTTEREASQRQHPRLRPCAAGWKRSEYRQVLFERCASSRHQG